MKIALLTCDKFPSLIDADKPLIPAFAVKNIIAEAVIWNDTNINWLDYDYLIFRNTWDYYENQTEFDDWLDKIEKLGVKTLNAISVIKQNKHKFYLKSLLEKRVNVIPTIFIDKTSSLNLKNLIPTNWEKIVIKPAYSAGSYLTELFEKSDIELINSRYSTIAAEKDLLLQEFIPEIKTFGETSLVFFNKKFSHAVNKQAIAGDFRIQKQYGGIYSLTNISFEILSQAQEILNNFDTTLLYARVDGIIINNKLHLMEVECIEPDLYFNLAEDSIDNFVNSVLQIVE